MVFPDQLRYDWAGFDEPAVNAPTLKALAAAGTRFRHAYSPSPLCETSRGCLASGRDYETSPVKNPHTLYPAGDPETPTFYSLLQKAGYHTMLAGKDHLRGNRGFLHPGAVRHESLGFSDAVSSIDKYVNTAYPKPVEAYGAEISQVNLSSGESAFAGQKRCYGVVGLGQCCDRVPLVDLPAMDMNRFLGAGYQCPRFSPLPDRYYPDNWIEAMAERLLARKPEGRPWFMQLGFLGPHPPFILTRGMNASVAGKGYPGPVGSHELPGGAKKAMRAGYAALVENIDGLLGRLLERLRESGELENTVVAFLSDHGEMLGDFDLVEKSVPWEGSAHVPLIVSGPGLRRGVVEDAPTTTLDVVATFLELAGAAPHPAMSSRSLLPLLRGSASEPPRDFVQSGLVYAGNNYDWHMVVRRLDHATVLKLICCPKGCPTSLANKISRNGSPTLLLQEVAGKATEEELASNVMHTRPEEAAAMLELLPLPYQTACRGLLPRA